MAQPEAFIFEVILFCAKKLLTVNVNKDIKITIDIPLIMIIFLKSRFWEVRYVIHL